MTWITCMSEVQEADPPRSWRQVTELASLMMSAEPTASDLDKERAALIAAARTVNARKSRRLRATPSLLLFEPPLIGYLAKAVLTNQGQCGPLMQEPLSSLLSGDERRSPGSTPARVDLAPEPTGDHLSSPTASIRSSSRPASPPVSTSEAESRVACDCGLSTPGACGRCWFDKATALLARHGVTCEPLLPKQTSPSSKRRSAAACPDVAVAALLHLGGGCDSSNTLVSQRVQVPVTSAHPNCHPRAVSSCSPLRTPRLSSPAHFYSSALTRPIPTLPRPWHSCVGFPTGHGSSPRYGWVPSPRAAP